MKKNLIVFGRGATYTSFLLGATLLLRSFLGLIVFADETLQPPSFPSCSIQTPPGDRAHYDYGWHQIPADGLIEGSDDVYSLSAGNFIQCYCPVEGTDGIQTNWWKFGELSQEEIDAYVAAGWVLEENGSDWNLDHAAYLAKNLEYNCGEITPTPTLTPTPTPTPPSPPGPPGPQPVCTGADLGGFAPTITEIKRVDADTVHACWTASTPNADDYIVYYGMSRDNLPWNTKVENSRCVDIHQVPAGHVYLKVAATDNCVVGPFSSIVEQTPQVLGATVLKELPSTGASLLILLAFAPVGYYLYKRFRLV